MRAIQQRAFGGPEVLEFTDVPVPRPTEDEVLISVSSAGINFSDLHARENRYLRPQELPLIPGSEIAGTLEDGRRVVAYCYSGGYAEQAVAPRSLVFEIPPDIDDETALCLFVQGNTAYHLTATAAPVRDGDSALVVSGAGGTGSMLIALLRHRGAGRVIATASTADKRKRCLELGADAAIDGGPDDLTQRILEANEGRPVDLVYDCVGGDVFDQALAALAPLGRLAVYGISSGKPNQPRTSHLLRGSKAVAGFWLEHCRERPQLIADGLDRLFDMVRAGEISPQVGGRYDLADAAVAHRDLAARTTTGKLILRVATPQ